MDLLEYMQKFYPSILEEYNVKHIPCYYEGNVLYHPITNGFGCGEDGSDVPFKIIKALPLLNGDFCLSFQNQRDKKIVCGVLLSEAYKKMRRIKPYNTIKASLVPRDNTIIYMKVDGKYYVIHKHIKRNHNNMGYSMNIIVYYDEKHYYHLYKNGDTSVMTLKHVHGYDSVDRELYTIKHNVSIKEFKMTVFGISKIRLVCHMFPTDFVKLVQTI